MKKVLLGCGGALVVALVLGGVAVLIVFKLTAPMTHAADAFFERVGSGDLETALSYLSQDFQAATPPDALEAFLRGTALSDATSTSWSSRSFENKTGKLEGTITTRTGGTVPVTLSMVKEGEAWKIQSISKAPSGLTPAVEEPSVPTKAESAELVTRTTMDFAEAVLAEDLGKFHRKASRQFQEQVPMEKFRDAFGAFVERKIDLTSLRDVSPLFTEEPGITGEGVLVLDGRYPAKGADVNFAYKYVLEDGAWKVLGINLDITPREAP